ncbi:MAG: hypothetical protein GY737_07085 [Desulfobacteraceae bacterium]|nr:hypothetical protein [Desulfobacteraceae bacterium]
MKLCYQSGDFKKYFMENMKALNLSVPANLFDTSEKAIATASLILGAIQALGKEATIAEVAGATVGLEKLLVLGAISASGYIGAVIGSIIVATGRSLAGGYQISDVFIFLERNNLKLDNWNAFYSHNPEILDKNHKFRNNFGMKCKQPSLYFQYAL